MTRLKWYRLLKNLTLERLGNALGVTAVSAGRYCQSRSSDNFRQPQSPEVGAKICSLTSGVIHLGNYAEEVTAAEAADMMAEIARREEEAKGREAAHG